MKRAIKNIACENCHRQISSANIAKHRHKCSPDSPTKRGGDRRSLLAKSSARIEHRHMDKEPERCTSYRTQNNILTHGVHILKDLRVVLHRIDTSDMKIAKHHHRRAGYSSREIACLQRIFKNDTGQALQLRRIGDILRDDDEGKELLVKYTKLQLRDKVKSLKK